MTPQVWVCPTIQRLYGNPNLSVPESRRLDYFAMTFDRRPGKAHESPVMPWFVESSNMHGGGQLMIFPDGHVQGTHGFVAALPKPPK